MTYEIVFSKKAMKQLKKLEKEIQKRVINSLKRIRVRPEDFIMKLVGDPGYKLRVGVYRIIIDLDYEKKQMHVLKVGHRRTIYDR